MNTAADIVIMLDDHLPAYPEHWPIVFRTNSTAIALREKQFETIVEVRPRSAWQARRTHPTQLTDSRTGQVCPGAVYQLRPRRKQS